MGYQKGSLRERRRGSGKGNLEDGADDYKRI